MSSVIYKENPKKKKLSLNHKVNGEEVSIVVTGKKEEGMGRVEFV